MNEETSPVPMSAEQKQALLAHIVPFVTWVLLMEFLGSSAVAYAIRTAVCLGLLLWFRPWRWYGRMNLKELPLAVLVGVVVFVIWVFPESGVCARWPGIQNAYLRFGTLPPWGMPEPLTETPHAPEVCGWSLTVIRLLGSTLIVAFIEEYFWRGFLYRWLIDKDFTKVSLATVQVSMILVVSLIFGFEHRRWLVGVIAGGFYVLLAVKRGDLGLAITAHATTNLLLGLYVLATGSYAFW